jgi:hypothetical protein
MGYKRLVTDNTHKSPRHDGGVGEAKQHGKRGDIDITTKSRRGAENH